MKLYIEKKRIKKIPLLILVLLFVSNVNAQKNEAAIISLTGTAKQYILPDLAIINLVIRIENTDEGKALQQVQETTKTVAEKMKNFGFKKDQVKLTDFSLEEKYTHKKNEGRIKVGYIGEQTVKIKTPIEAETISRFLAYISKNKLENTAINFNTELSEDLEEKTRLQLIQKALQNAKLKANVLAKTSGVTITGVSKIGYNESEPVIEQADRVFKFEDEEIPDEKALESEITALLSIEEIEVMEAISVIYTIKNGQ